MTPKILPYLKVYYQLNLTFKKYLGNNSGKIHKDLRQTGELKIQKECSLYIQWSLLGYVEYQIHLFYFSSKELNHLLHFDAVYDKPVTNTASDLWIMHAIPR